MFLQKIILPQAYLVIDGSKCLAVCYKHNQYIYSKKVTASRYKEISLGDVTSADIPSLSLNIIARGCLIFKTISHK